VRWPVTGNCPDNAAVEVAIIKNNGNVRRSAYRVGNCRGEASDFTTLTLSGSTISTPNIGIVTGLKTTPTNDRMARIKVLFVNATYPNGLPVSVSSGGGGDLPTQVYEVKSSAQAADGTTRVVTANSLANSLPSIFDYVLFSGDTIVK
jgi:hypothetical protein